ncbi:hypothetical protein [Microcoleus sp. F4-D5]|uniref:hypothetical protein n=1 Tax=Microcoleus sp. F4-D5 TaxID=2818760 RepID=UPI002FD79470
MYPVNQRQKSLKVLRLTACAFCQLGKFTLNKIPFSPSEIVKAVRSIANLVLLDAIEQEQITLFSLNRLLKQYVKTQYLSN